MSKPVYDDERGWVGVTDKPDSHALAVYEAGVHDERVRIRQAVEALRKNYYGEELDLAKVKGYLLAIIDEDADA